MDLSTLESISKALEESLDFWGLMLLLATALVVIGLVVEYWHDVQEFWARLTWPMASFPWDKFTALVGGILVTIGVAGELFVTYKASHVETKLRENSHKIEALLTQEAGDAKISAESAASAADRANASAGQAYKAARGARQEAARLQTQLIRQDRREHRLEGKAEQHFREYIEEFRGQTFDIRFCSTPDIESRDLYLRLDAELFAVGWKRNEFRPWLGCTTGIIVNLDPSASKTAKDAAEALRQALSEIGLTEAPVRPLESRKPLTGEALLSPSTVDTVLILVGSHP